MYNFTFFPLYLYTKARAQCNDEKKTKWLVIGISMKQRMMDFSIGTFISNIFTPQIIIDIKTIREYVRDKRFPDLRIKCGDMRAIDAIYLKSLKIADYNIARALFLSFMAGT